jgi:hypothetical protein
MCHRRSGKQNIFYKRLLVVLVTTEGFFNVKCLAAPSLSLSLHRHWRAAKFLLDDWHIQLAPPQRSPRASGADISPDTPSFYL